MRPRQLTDNNNSLAWEENIKVWDSQASEAVMSPHTYGAGTRLSSAYTAGRNGLPLPRYCAVRGSAAAIAWQHGHDEHLAKEAKRAAWRVNKEAAVLAKLETALDVAAKAWGRRQRQQGLDEGHDDARSSVPPPSEGTIDVGIGQGNETMAKSMPVNENPLREASAQARSSLSLLIERVQKPVQQTRAEQAQILDDAATFYLRYNPSRSPADTAWPDALRAGAKSLRQWELRSTKGGM